MPYKSYKYPTHQIYTDLKILTLGQQFITKLNYYTAQQKLDGFWFCLF